MRGAAAAPASSANLGPGFDTLALALELRCHVTAEESADWDLTSDGAPMIGPGMALVREAAGPEPLRIVITSDIPIGRGLGSSAAVVAAVALAAGRARGRPLDRAALFRRVAQIDGHPDNAAATVYGGLMAVSAGVPRRLLLSPELAVVLAVPDAQLPTSAARAVLPQKLGHGAGARSVARAIFLVEGLRTAEPEAFAGAAGDELHELTRGPLSPLTSSLIAVALEAGALHAAWSGAGPAALALSRVDDADRVAAAMAKAMGEDGTVLRPAVAFDGVN